MHGDAPRIPNEKKCWDPTKSHRGLKSRKIVNHIGDPPSREKTNQGGTEGNIVKRKLARRNSPEGRP